MRVFKYGKLFEWIYPKRIWSKSTKEKVIYLTFDDGPVPEATPYVLQELSKINAKATFFMVGDNVKKNQDLFFQVVNAGHRVANHTMNHVKGTRCRVNDYKENVQDCQEQILEYNQPPLLRPPYGKMTKKQAFHLSEYQIIMWSVLTYDFDAGISAETCLKKSIEYTKEGSIVLMHDSLKTLDKLRYVLPKFLDHFHKQGFEFKAL